jgi:uncharacterized phage-associated protein
MENAQKLGFWIRAHHSKPLTHLKLQKLAFYCYGAALAFDLENEIGTDISFQPWEHGPVNRELWDGYKGFGASPLPTDDLPLVSYSDTTSELLEAVLAVYGKLDAWALRNQSHLEKPWKDSYEKKCEEIDKDELRKHFHAKFYDSAKFPEYLLHASNFAIDGLPSCEYRDIKDLAKRVRQAFGE